MYNIQKNSFVIFALLTFAIMATITAMIQQVYGGIGGTLGEIVEDVEDSEVGKVGGDIAETTVGVRSTGDLTQFSVPIPFTIPTPMPLSGTILLTGDLKNIQNADVDLTIAGFQPTDLSLGSDYTIEQHYEATIEDIIRDLSSGSITEIDEGKEFLSNTFGIDIGPLAKLKMDVSIKVPIPQTLNDVTQIQNIVPVPSLVLQGCYNKISNNLPDADDSEGVMEVVKDRNNTINQEDECTTLLTV
jgi:hypothetical protein